MNAIAAPPSPYKGLAPFEDSALDALLFFGREREIEVIVANLMAARLTILFGPSGVGKTSLLRAGVAHRLRSAPGAVVAVVSSWTGDPIEEILNAVDASAGDDASRPTRRGTLADVLAVSARRLDADVYVILDQFEEYFLYHEGEYGPGTLAEELPDALRRAGLRANFLLGIRDDSLAALDPLKPRIPNLFANSLRLDRLDRTAARAAILGPLERYNELVASAEPVTAEPELVDELLHQVAVGRVDLGQTGRGGIDESDAERIEAPYLQLVLERLWEIERERGSNQLRLSTLAELGGAARIVEDHLERAMDALSSDEKDAAAAIYNHLVTPSGTKIAHRARDLAGYADVDEDETQRVLHRLVEERIVRAGEDGAAGPRYEIFHDVLAEAVLAWRTRHEAERRLEEERRAAARRHRRLLAFAVSALVLIAILAAVAIFALAQRHDARSQARRARGRELAALASTAEATDPEGAVRLALDAANEDRSPAIADVLRGALRGMRVEAVLPVPRGPVADVDFSPDGKRLVTAGGDGVARVYRTGDGRRLLALGHAGSDLTTAVFNADGSLIATGGKDGTARIWNARTGRQLHVLKHERAVTSVAFAREGGVIATASEDGTARLWDVATGALRHMLRHPGPVRSVSFDRHGTMLVTALLPRAHDRTARVFDVNSGNKIYDLVQESPLTSARFAPSGYLILTGSIDGSASLWDARSGMRVRRVSGHESEVLDAEFSPSGRQFATASADETARVVETRTGELDGVLTNHHLFVLRAVFSPDGETVATASSDRAARVFLPNGTLRATLVGHRESVTDVAFSRDGRSVATASLDGTARIWDRRPQPDLGLVGRQRAAVAAVGYTGDGGRVVSAAVNGVVLVSRRDGRPRPPLRSFRIGRHLSAAAVSADGGSIAVATPRDVEVWDVSTGRRTQTLASSGGAISLAFSRDGREVAIVGRDHHARVWVLGQHTARPVGKGGVLTAALSPEGRRLATGGMDRKARIWDVNSGRLLVGPLMGHSAAILAVAISPDGRYLATVSKDHDGRLWDAHSGRRLPTLRGHFALIRNVAFSSDSRWVVTAGPGSAGVWDVHTGRALFFLNAHDQLTSAAFSPARWRIATGGLAGTVKTYDCRLCGGIDDLIAVGRERLANLRH